MPHEVIAPDAFAALNIHRYYDIWPTFPAPTATKP
jgi:hypothetical protein